VSLLTRDKIKTLSRELEGPFVSIFMPAYQAGPDTQQNPIRFKVLVGQAEERLIEEGLQAADVRKLLEPARELLNDYDFWQHQNSGLAVYLSPGLFQTYRLPLKFEELVMVSDTSFHFKPLLPLLSDDGQFYILAISQNALRLFQGTRHSIQELDLQDVPHSLAEALRFDDSERQLQFHTATPDVQGGGPVADQSAIYHGHAGDEDNKKTDILRYFQQVDRGLKDFLKDDPAPLILAGVEYLFPIYKEANTYQHLLDEGIVGNPDKLKPDELHQQAWPVIQPYFEQARQEAMARFMEMANNSEAASADIREIVPAAYYGRVETLFVPLTLQQWGSFDPNSSTVNLHDELLPGDEELYDLAAVQTLINGGIVYAVEPDKAPGSAPVAAIFRYSIR
jgi:hypothetical protein